MNTRRSAGMVCFFFLACAFLPARAGVDPYALLKAVPTYAELLKHARVNSYAVPVTVTGKLWDEMQAVIAQRNVGVFRLVEYYRAPAQVALRMELGDSCFANLVPAIIDPVQIFRLLLQELESYKEPKRFAELKKNSRADMVKHGNMFIITLVPAQGGCILVQARDQGTEVVETKLEKLVAEVEEGTNLIRSLEVLKKVKQRSMQGGGGVQEQQEMKFTFSYVECMGNQYPQELAVWRNNDRLVRFWAEYREQDGRLLPRKKNIEYAFEGKTERAVFEYGAYRLNIFVPDKVFESGAPAIDVQMQRANKISLEAQNALANGRVYEAKRRLQTLILLYPKTPQAMQAKAFLDGLPE